MSNTTVSKTSTDSQTAKFAVVRLKPGDNLLGLFQLLIHNGFGEVSFVNNLSETIFPAIGGGGGGEKRSSSPEPIPKKDETTGGGPPITLEKASLSNRGTPERVDSAKGGSDKPRLSHITAASERFQPPPPQVQLPIRTLPLEHRMCPPGDPILAQKVTSDHGVTSDDLSINRAKRNPLDLNLIPQSAAAAAGSTTLPTFANMPSNFLGLPTMSSLNTTAAAAAAIAALSEAATPPYSLANFFTPNSLSSSIPSAGLLPPTANGAVHQYSPALLAAAAAAQQHRQASSVAASSTANSSIPPRPRSPNLQTLATAAQLSRPPMPPQPQQRIHMNQPAYPFQQHQFQLTQPRLAFPQQQQQSKVTQQKSPPAPSPSSSSSNSNSNSSQNGIPPSNCAPMPPGCATTQLRQRGQRSYAEDPSLYVACRLCKNKIMGSRISNLTNHVRRHSSMKQFQCCYCDYTHNEMAKVRLHMLHNHKDKDSQPIDNLSPEMQASWDLLMKECFPDHCQQQQQQQPQSNSASPPQQSAGVGSNGGTVASMISHHLQLQCQSPSASAVTHIRGGLSLQQITCNPDTRNRSESASNGSIEAVSPHDEKCLDQNLQVLVHRRDVENANNASPTSSTSTSSIISAEATTPPVNQYQPQPQLVARCIECGTFVNAKLKARHIRKCHLQCLLPFVCSMCGYDHSEHSKVKVHICLKHDDDPMAQVVTRDLSTYAEQLVPEYFPEAQLQYAGSVHQAPTRSSSEPVAGSTHDSARNEMPEEVTASKQEKTGSAIVYTQPESDLRKECARLVMCTVCRRSIRATKAIHHARKHISANCMIHVCSVCHRYKTASRIRMRWHMVTKHNQNDAKVHTYKRASTAAVGMVKRAVSRCFPARNKVAWILKCAKAGIARCRSQQQQHHQQQQQRKKSLRKHAIQKRQLGMRTALKSRHWKKRQWTENERANGAHLSSATMLTKNPVIKSEPKMELQTAVDMATATAPTDLFRMCPLCARWIRSDQLTAHLQSHVPAMGAAYRCTLCDYTAPDIMLVRGHFLQEHQKVQVQQQQPQHDAHLLLTYANLCRASSSTATAADG